MKAFLTRLLFIIAILLVISILSWTPSKAQTISQEGQYQGYQKVLGAMWVDSLFKIPMRPLTKWKYTNSTVGNIGLLQVNPADSLPYYGRNDNTWWRFLTINDTDLIKHLVDTGSIQTISLSTMDSLHISDGNTIWMPYLRKSDSTLSWVTVTQLNDSMSVMRIFVTTSINDTAISVRNFALTALADTAAAIRASMTGGAGVSSITATSPLTATGTATVTIGINTITATSVLANTTTANATPAQSISYSSAYNTSSNLVSRDANGNTHSNNFESATTGYASVGTYSFTSATSRINVFSSGSGTCTVILTDAKTLNNGHIYEFNNNGSGSMYIKDNSTGNLFTLLSGGYAYVILLSNSFSAGQWDYHFALPANAKYGTLGLTITGTASVTSTINASNFSGSSSGTNTGDQTIVATGVMTATGTSTVTVGMPAATGSNGGYLTLTDWNTFNGKGIGTVTSISTTTPLSGGPITGTGTIAISKATTLTDGYLSATDWTTFNGKGSGTVKSVGLIGSSTMSVTGTASPITTSGTYTLTVPASSIGTVNLSATGSPSATTFLRGDNTWGTPPNSGGTVTSLQVVSNAAAYSVTPNSAITSSGIYSIIPTGTSSQFVKGDGSKDGTTYLSTAVTSIKVVSNLTCYSITPTTTVTSSGVYSLVATGTSSQFAKGDGSLDGNTYLTSNQTITVSGAVTGSGTNSISTTLSASVVGIANLSATGTPSATTYLRGDNTWGTPSGGVTPGGNTNAVQYNNSGTFGGASEFEISSDGNLASVTQSYTTTASSPVSGRLKMYSSSLNGAPEIHTVTDGGTEAPLQTAIRVKTQGRFYTNGTSLITEGFYSSAAGLSGSTTFNLITYDAINTAPNFLYYKVTTAASANSQAELYYGFTGRDAIIGNDAAGGGSQLTIIFCLPNYASTQRVFAGYAATFGNIGTTADPSAQLNTVGVGKDAADATLQFMFNNGSGTATKISTGITPTANDVYIVTVTLPSNTTTETVSITRKKKGSADIFASSTASSKIPTAGTLMYSHALSNTGAASVAVSIGVISFTEEKYGF